MSGDGELRSTAANTVIFRNININSSDIRFEPRVEDSGRISIYPVVESGLLNFGVTNDFINDPRKDEGALMTSAVEETLWGDVNIAVDIKSWRHGTLYVQADVGYYSGNVGPIEVAVDIAEEAILNPVDQDLTADDPFANYQFIYPSAGTVTQVPMSVSGLWQFRPRSPFRPYIGVGVGYMTVDVSDSAQLNEVNAQLAGIEYNWIVQGELIDSGQLPETLITVNPQSNALYTVRGGLEYNVNRNWSIYISANYIQTAARVQYRALGYQDFGIGIGRNDQINDVEGITGEDAFIQRLLSLPVEEAVALVADVDETSDIPSENERSYYTVFPVALGTPIDIEIPNPTDPNAPTTVTRQSKIFVRGGDVQMDSFSMGLGFRYRF